MPAEPALRVLLVDDDELFCMALADLLGSETLELVSVHSLAQARRRSECFDLVVLDDRLPDGRGLSLLADPAQWPRTPGGRPAQLVVISASQELDTAIAALRSHAIDYLCKPIDPERLRALIASLRAGLHASASSRASADAGELLGASAAMQRMRAGLLCAAGANSPVLLGGETGTGKSLAARWLHERSERAQGPFVALNCASLPDSLVESELFGSERGAFTGASERRVGLFEAADRGTLFLDEIAELPLAAQAKLLDVLESGQVRRLGSTRTRAIDVRIVAATHVDLAAAVAAGRFRRDLLYRLDVLRIEVPALRERSEDLECLIAAMLARVGDARELASGELARLRAYAWPGNIRELRNLIERARVLQPEGPLRLSAWLREHETEPRAADPHAHATLPVHELTMQHILAVVRASPTRKQAAAQLGIGESTLRRKLKDAERETTRERPPRRG